MANQLEEKPGNAYEDDWGSRDIPGIDTSRTAGDSDLPSRHPNNLEGAYNAPSASSLKDAEETAGAGSADEASKSEADQVGKGYYSDGEDNSSSLKPKRFRLTRKRAATAGIILTLLGGGGFMGFSILQGPAEIVHVAQILQRAHFSSQEDAADGRLGKLYRFMKKDNNLGETRLTWVESKYNKNLIADMENKGFIPDFDQHTNELKGFTIDKTKKDSPFYGQSDEEIHKTLNGQGIPTEAQSGKIYSEAKGFRNQNRASKFFVKQLGKNKISTAVSKRVFKKYGWVTWHPLQKVDKKLNQSVADRYKSWKEKREERLKNGVKGSTIDTTGANEVDDDGNKIPLEGSSDTPDSDKIAKTLDQIKSSGSLKVAGGLAAATGIVCTAKTVNDNIDDIRYIQIIKPLIRMGADAVTVGSQIMSGQDIDMETAGFVAKSFRGADKDGKVTSWSQAKSIRAETGQDGGLDINPATKDVISEGAPDWLNWTENGAVGSMCSGVGQAAAGVVSVTITVVSGGLISGVTGAVLTGIGSNIAISKLSSLLAGDAVNVAATGAEWGNDVNYGARMFGNAMALSSGGTKLTDDQVAALKANQAQEDRQEYTSKNFFARMFDPYDYRSLTGKAMDSSPNIQSYSDVASIFQSIPSVFGKALKAPASLFISKTHAATSYDYGFPQIGFSEEDLGNSDVADPYKNAELAAGILNKNGQGNTPDYIQRAKDCYGINIEKDSNNLWTATPADQVDDVYKAIYDKKSDYDNRGCIDNGNKDWLRIRFFIFDTTVMDGWACYEGDDESCLKVGAGNSAANDQGSAGSTSSTANADIDTAHLFSDSTNVACADGTKDLGKQNGYTDGKMVPIRICAIPGFPSTGQESNNGFGVKGADGNVVVNSRVSGAVKAMVNTARDDGVSLDAISSFRTMSHQQSLCPCDGISVARPGYSNHQMGLAIDFGGGLPSTPGPISGNKTWEWLSKNANRYGYKNYPREAWHWSPTGS